MGQPIYNKSLETHPVFADHTSRQMTPEEMIHYGVTEFKPVTDMDGKAIKPAPFKPFQTTKQKEQAAARLVKPEKPKEKMGRKESLKFKHVTKEFIESELAAGKSFNKIGIENGMSKSLIFKRATKFGLYEAKTYAGGKKSYGVK